jgi:hypothetical protein
MKQKKNKAKRTAQSSSQPKNEIVSKCNVPPGSPLGEVVFEVIASRLRQTAERAEVRSKAPEKSDNEIEREICNETLLQKLRPVLRAYEVEQAIALLPCLVEGARTANSAALKLLHALAFFGVLTALKSEPEKSNYNIVDAFAENMLHELVHIVETGELRKDTKPAA